MRIRHSTPQLAARLRAMTLGGLTLALAVAATSAPLEAQTARRGSARAPAPQPERTIEFPESTAQCSARYHAALSGLMAEEAAQPLATVKRIRTALPGLKGAWLFQEGGERRRQRDAQSRLVDGDKVCTEEVNHAGRSKCLRWEARAPEPPREPPVPTPPMSKAEAKLAKQIAEFVQNRGAPPEFLSNGKYTIMSERVAGDLESYLTQPAHAALCTGAEEFLEFLDDQLPLLLARAGTVAEMQTAARAAAGERIAMLQAAIAAATHTASPPTAGAVLAASGAPAPRAPEPQPAASAIAAVHEIAGLALAPGHAAAVRSEASALPALSLAAAAFGSDGGSPLAPAPKAEARAALRTAELATYVELLNGRYRELDAGLFAKIAAARSAHARTCTCDD
jgi:hypothetical protein